MQSSAPQHKIAAYQFHIYAGIYNVEMVRSACYPARLCARRRADCAIQILPVLLGSAYGKSVPLAGINIYF